MTSVGRFSCAVTLAMVNVLPKPVTTVGRFSQRLQSGWAAPAWNAATRA
jgi:hypothetical protein